MHLSVQKLFVVLRKIGVGGEYEIHFTKVPITLLWAEFRKRGFIQERKVMLEENPIHIGFHRFR